MSIQDELIKIEAQIKVDQGDLQERLKESSNRAYELKEEIDRLDRGLAGLKTQGRQNSDEFKLLNTRLKDAKKEFRECKEDSKQLSKVLDMNSMSANQLRQRSNTLKNALNSLNKDVDSERWKELNMEYKECNKRLKEVQAGADDTGKTMAGMKSIISSFSLASMIGVAVVGLRKIVSSIKEGTQTISDMWNRTTTGMEWSYNQFIKTISTGDWSNFFGNLEEAYRKGKQFADQLDELFEMGNSLAINESKINAEIVKQQEIVDDVNKSEAERIKAASIILDKYKEIGEMRKQVASQEMDTYKGQLDWVTKLSDKEKEYIIDNYNLNKGTIAQATKLLEYKDKISKLEKERGSTTQIRYVGEMAIAQEVPMNVDSKEYKEISSKIEEYKALSQVIKDNYTEVEYAAEVLNKYNVSNDEVIQNYVKSYEKLIKVDSEVFQMGRRIQRQYNTLMKSISDEKLKKQEEVSKLSKEQKANEYKKEIELAESNNNSLKEILQKKYLSGEIDQREFSAKSLSLEQELLYKKIEINEIYGHEVTSLYQKIYAQQIEEINKINQLIDSSLKEVQDSVDITLNSATDEFLKEYERLSKNATLLNPVQSLDDSFNAGMDDLVNMYELKLISEEEFLQQKKELTEDYNRQIREIEAEGWINGIQKAQQYLQAASNIVNAVQQAQFDQLEASKQKELSLAGNNAEKREQIEEEYAQKKLAIEQKYADIQMGIQIAQAISGAALAAITTWSQLGFPLGIPAVAALGVVTAAQIASIVAQRNAIRNKTITAGTSKNERILNTGYSDGGYTGDGMRLEPAGIVHKGEYVVPQPILRMPVVREMVSHIENIRTNKVSPSGVGGFADGGYTGNPTDDKRMGVIMSKLLEVLSNPLRAYTLLSDNQAASEIDRKFKKVTGRRKQ